MPQVLDYRSQHQRPPRRELRWLLRSLACTGSAILLDALSFQSDWGVGTLVAVLLALLAVICVSVADALRDPEQTTVGPVLLVFLAAMAVLLHLLCAPSLGST